MSSKDSKTLSLDGRREAPERPRRSCRNVPCKWHEPQASDAEIESIQRLTDRGATYISVRGFCQCLSCLMAYSDGCALVAEKLLYATLPYLTSPGELLPCNLAASQAMVSQFKTYLERRTLNLPPV